MIRVAFTVPGEPVAKGRAKFARRGNFVTTYTPEKTARYENLVKLAAEAAMAEHHLTLLEGPVELRVFAVRSIPASWSAKKRLAAAAGELRPITKPDLDNIVKAIKDGCNKVVWLDDSQVCDIQSKKRYGDPRVEVEIWGTC